MDTKISQRMNRPLAEVDPDIADVLREEGRRQGTGLELIPSENFVSEAVLEAMGSVLTNKYAEGYPGKRYYGGCEFADRAEQLAIDRAKALFGAEHANVQTHSGTQANVSVYMAALQPGDTVLGMNLAHGGHLTHGHPLNFSGKMYKFIPYGVNKETERIDYDELARLADEHKPKMIVGGASAYSRIIDFPRMAEIAREVGALFFVDMAHIAGLVAGGMHPSPVPHADFVSTTTHKTLRGPRGGLVLCKQQFAKELDRITFPGTQGGPLMHIIAAKAVCLKEAADPGFREYAKQIVANAQKLAAEIAKAGFRIVSGGTDNHLFLIDLYSRGITGKDAQPALDRAGITVNKNSIPFDPTPPMTGGGIRLGTPAITTRGMRETEMGRIAAWISEVLLHLGDGAIEQRIRGEVAEFAVQFPLYTRRWDIAPTLAGREAPRAERGPPTLMRVAIDIRRAGDFGHGTYIRNIVNQFARSDRETEYLLIGQQSHIARFDPLPENFQLLDYPSPPGSFHTHMHLPYLLHKQGVDLLHMPWFYAPAVVPTRMVITVHDLTDVLMPPPGVPEMMQTGRLFFARRALARADRIMAVSHSTKRELSRVFNVPEEKIEVVYNALDERFVREPMPTDANRILERHAVTDPFVLYAGNIKPQKNLPRLIEAFAVVKADLRDHPEYANLKLLLIGDSAEEHSDLRRAVLRSRLQGDVRFLGFVPHSVLRVFYSRARAFLFPSLYEGFGLPPLEAMAHGAPVLTSSVSSLPEVFSQAALLVNPENVFEIARGIRQILTEDVLRETLVRRGYELVRKYSWERSAEQVREVYRSVVAGEPVKSSE